MKQLKYLIIIIVLVASCKKNGRDSNQIRGEWEWFKSSGWITTTPQSTGKTWQLTFRSDGSCEQTGTLFQVSIGTYKIKTDSIWVKFNGESNHTPYSYGFISTMDTLFLDPGSFIDFPIHYFVRKH